MRRFHYGPKSGISADSLSYTQVRQHPIKSAHPDTISLFSIEAQICPEPLGLYVRMQDIVLFRTRDELIYAPNHRALDPLIICDDHRLLGIIRPLVQLLHREEKVPFADTCQICNTDYQIEISEFDSKIALIITRWVNLGRGLTPDHPMWKIHACFPAGGHGLLDRGDPEHFLQSPRICFEDMATQSIDDLRSRNLSYLRDQQYKRVMPFTAAELDVWHISYTEPWKKGRIGSLLSLVGRTSRDLAVYDPPSSRRRWDFLIDNQFWNLGMPKKSIYGLARRDQEYTT